MSTRRTDADSTGSTPDGALPFGIGTEANRATGALRTAGSRLAEGAVRAVRCVAFWIAALLPLAYLPAFATGVAKSRPLALAVLLALNGLSIVVGHDHNRPD